MADTIFGEVDKHPNSSIDKGEFLDFGRSVFTSMDSNEDKSVDFEEFSTFDFGFKAIAQDAGRPEAYDTAQRILFAMFDRDGNLSIAVVEFEAVMNADFHKADLDNDENLTRAEYLDGYMINIAYRAALEGQ
ncbi:signal transduction protein [Ruegeria sp. THAF57]|uniref:signal transduction protein n=1 Tax=Ruegeria sp. THAF57 TaxID=2744555 RepID=UPI0015DD96F8|nr:signal transduction protein [Ruegeria sp. THAF57]